MDPFSSPDNALIHFWICHQREDTRFWGQYLPPSPRYPRADCSRCRWNPSQDHEHGRGERLMSKAAISRQVKFLTLAQPGGLHNIRTSECRRSLSSRNFGYDAHGFGGLSNSHIHRVHSRVHLSWSFQSRQSRVLASLCEGS